MTITTKRIKLPTFFVSKTDLDVIAPEILAQYIFYKAPEFAEEVGKLIGSNFTLAEEVCKKIILQISKDPKNKFNLLPLAARTGDNNLFRQRQSLILTYDLEIGYVNVEFTKCEVRTVRRRKTKFTRKYLKRIAKISVRSYVNDLDVASMYPHPTPLLTSGPASMLRTILTDAELDQQYPFIENPNGDEPGDQKFETYGVDLEAVKAADPACVWTQTDTATGVVIVSGYYFVDRICYYISKVPVPADQMYKVIVTTD